jgi:hypothetical protein
MVSVTVFTSPLVPASKGGRSLSLWVSELFPYLSNKNSRLPGQPTLNGSSLFLSERILLLIAAAPTYMSSARTVQQTPPPTAPLLSRGHCSDRAENIYIYIQFVPHRKHNVSATTPSRLMLFGRTVAVYCENHIEHTDTDRISQETYYISATKPSRLMLFGRIVAVYCENHTEHTDTDRISQEGYYISATKPNRLMLFIVRTIRDTQIHSVGRMQ